MNFVHFSTNDTGGAGNAAYTLHKNLTELGHESILFVSKKSTKDIKVVQISNFFFLYLLKFLYKVIKYLNVFKKNYYFHDNRLTTIISLYKIKKLLKFKPDFIFIHSISNFISLKLIYKVQKYFNAPLFWLLMDMAPFTGGCHFSWGCDNYLISCKKCPAINIFFLKNLAEKNLKFKSIYLKKMKINIISTSKFLMKQSSHSKLFSNLNNYYIPLGINENIFKPTEDKNYKRLTNNLKIDGKIILFSTSDIMEERKGFKYLLKSLIDIDLNNLISKNLTLLTFGFLNKKIEFNNIKHYHYPYTLNLDKRIEIYNLADFFISTSIEDSGPTTIIEAMMCGVPVISFNTGNAVDYVINGFNGYKVRLKDSVDLRNKITKIFSLNSDELLNLSKNARIFSVENLSQKKQIQLLEKIILNKNNDEKN
jgi:glycosyltransferase involved in cell wall biosynthesis